jgi:threonine dehydratase
MKEKTVSSKVGSTPVICDDFLKCFLKLECDNPSGSHKDRETFYFINKFGREKRYVIASSGSAGISLAYWMREKAVVLVPEVTPKEKIEAIKKFGAKVIVKGKYFYDSYKLVSEIAQKRGLINISPGFVERWRGDVAISYELKELKPEYVFIPSADLTLAYGIAYGFQKMVKEGLIEKLPTAISCVLPNHPLIKLCEDEDIGESYKHVFNSIYTHGEEGKNIEKGFLDFSFTKVESTTDLSSVLQLSKKYRNYDPAVLIAMFISRRYNGRKVVIVTGIKRHSQNQN